MSKNSTECNVQQPKVNYRYSVKVVNPAKKSDFEVIKTSISGKFESVDDLKTKLNDCLEFPVEEVGYIVPGHGSKGRMQELMDSNDLIELYNILGKRKDILLWCYKPILGPRKRVGVPDDQQPGPSKRAKNIAEKISEVELIVKRLKEEHKSFYSVEKLNAWAHMLAIGKHDSYHVPPDLPYFRGKHSSSGSTSLSPPAPSPSSASPSKRIDMRTQLLLQMEKWYSLLEKGGITQTQYDELQSAILKKIYITKHLINMYKKECKKQHSSHQT